MFPALYFLNFYFPSDLATHKRKRNKKIAAEGSVPADDVFIKSDHYGPRVTGGFFKMSFSGTGKTSFQHHNVFCTTDLIKQTAVTQRTAVRRGINELILLLFAKSITTKRRIL